MQGGRRNSTARYLAGLLGLAVGLLLLEGMLRLLGVAGDPMGADPPASARGGSFTILCEGDSFTWGAGARATMTWPRQLERRLNEGGGQRYVVVNRGMGGQNSAWMLQMLQNNLETTRPDLVILCTGAANAWDFQGHPSPGQVAVGPGGAEPEPGLVSTLRAGVQGLRVCRLLRRALLESREKAARDQRLAALEAGRKAFRDRVAKTVSSDELGRSRAWRLKGQQARQARRMDEAAECFRQGIAANPHGAENYLGLAEIQSDRFDFPKAVEWARSALEADPYSAPAYQAMARAFLHMHEGEGALECLARARELAPRDPVVLALVSHDYAMMQRYAEAFACLEQALACGPRFRGLVFQERALVYGMMREPDQALAAAQEALRAGGQPTQCRTLMGEAYLEKGEPGKALPLLEENLEAQSDLPSLSALARCYEELGQTDEALKCLERAAAISPAAAAEALADGYREAGREELAMEWYRKALAARPDVMARDISNKMRKVPVALYVRGYEPSPPADLSKVALTPVEAWIRADLAKAIALCRKSGALVLMHDYPGTEVRQDVLRAIAAENGVPFVDHQPSFGALAHPEEYFAPDLHCNERGYGLMARDLAPKVVEMLAALRQRKGL